MTDELRAWFNELRSRGIGSETAAQLIDKCEELADELHHAIDHHVVRGDNLTICVECGHRNKHAQGCWVGEAENALRAPGGDES